MAVRLSALRTRLTLLPTNIIILMFLVLISVRGWVNPLLFSSMPPITHIRSFRGMPVHMFPMSTEHIPVPVRMLALARLRTSFSELRKLKVHCALQLFRQICGVSTNCATACVDVKYLNINLYGIIWTPTSYGRVHSASWVQLRSYLIGKLRHLSRK
jgi:hypothetical protein